MRAVLMAGGEGTRLRPLTYDLPKPMVPILNRPIAEHILNLLKRHHITEVIATLFYLPDVMRDYFRDGSDFGVQMTYAVEDDHPLGTAGCVKNIAALLTSTFLVISGDSMTDFDLSAAIAYHKKKQSKATIILTRVTNPMEFGVVITDDSGRISMFLEKPSSSEIFSDTINTGIYILEPEVLDGLKEAEAADFSSDLFPSLLAQGVPMYGYVAAGYWCDIGSLDAYRGAQYDALRHKVKVDLPYPEQSPGCWIGTNTVIDPDAKIYPPVLIGNNCRVGPRSTLEPGTVLGDNVTVGFDANLNRPIVWNGAILGDETHLTACVISRGARVDRRAHVLEGAVVGALSVVGEEAQVNQGVKIWPSKKVEPGATLSINLIWGNTAPRHLFGQRGVSGLANVDITAEFAVKLGAAYASTLKPGSQVMVSRDQRSISRMISRSLISGLMSVGIHIQNLEATALPIARYTARAREVVGGIHVRIHPDRSDFIQIEFFDEQGINVSKAKEKKIEGAFFKEDFRRASIAEIGSITYDNQALDAYADGFEKLIRIRNEQTPFKVVIDYVYAVAGAVLPNLLNKVGCDVVVLNASLRQIPPGSEDREELLVQLSAVVTALKARLGIQVSANGEQLVVVDETGRPILGERLTALMVEISLRQNPRGTIVVPVHVSSAIEMIAQRHHAQVIRTKTNPTALMEACCKGFGVVMGGSAETGFIFPKLHSGFDAMFSIAKVIEALTLRPQTLSEIEAELPEVCYRTEQMRCPWNQKGTLMRHLIETHSAEQLELIDGVKIKHPSKRDHWLLVLPDADEPLIRLVANGCDCTWVNRTLQDYRQRLQTFESLEESLELNVKESIS